MQWNRFLQNLTGGVNGGAHCTDVTNASRTMLMNITSLKWDPTLLKFFDIPIEILPRIRSSSEIYGHIHDGVLRGVPISGVRSISLVLLVTDAKSYYLGAKKTWFLLFLARNVLEKIEIYFPKRLEKFPPFVHFYAFVSHEYEKIAPQWIKNRGRYFERQIPM